MTEKKTTTKRTRKPKPAHAIDFTVWAVNGGPLPEGAVEKFEAAIEQVQIELFNEGHRLLAQTTKG